MWELSSQSKKWKGGPKWKQRPMIVLLVVGRLNFFKSSVYLESFRGTSLASVKYDIFPATKIDDWQLDELSRPSRELDPRPSQTQGLAPWTPLRFT